MIRSDTGPTGPTGAPSAVLALEGDIDMSNYLQWRERGDLELASARTTSLTVDFRAVGFIDSCGLAVLAWLYNRVTPLGGVVSLANVPRGIGRLIDIAGMSPLFRDAA